MFSEREAYGILWNVKAQKFRAAKFCKTNSAGYENEKLHYSQTSCRAAPGHEDQPDLLKPKVGRNYSVWDSGVKSLMKVWFLSGFVHWSCFLCLPVFQKTERIALAPEVSSTCLLRSVVVYKPLVYCWGWNWGWFVGATEVGIYGIWTSCGWFIVSDSFLGWWLSYPL